MKFTDEKAIRKRYLGDSLREWRERQELTQSEVAAKLGYSTAQFISNWERGQSSPPLAALPKLGKLYRVKAAEIIQVVEDYHEALVEEKTKAVRRTLKSSSLSA